MSNMKRTLLFCFVLAFVAVIVAGCGGENTATNQNDQKKFTKENWSELDTNPDNFKGAAVDVVGKIFLVPEKDEDGTYFQMYADPKNSEFNTIVASSDPDLKIEDGDFVHVIGSVKGSFKGKNAFGGELTAPTVIAQKVEIVNPKDVLAPTKLNVDVNKTQEQHGLAITLNNIEFADEETRLYVTVNNGSQDEATFYSFNVKAIQGSNQFEEQNNYDVDYPEIASELLPGIESSGVVLLQPLAISANSAQIHLEGRTGNYDHDFKPYVFDVTW